MPQAYVFTAHGGPQVEAFADLPRPKPGPGQVLISVRAAGVNPVDWKLRDGFVRPGSSTQLPAVFGNEVAGVVEEVGAGVEGFAVGDEVFGNPATGGYAEFTLLPVDLTARKPRALSFAEAATLPVAAATAFDGLEQLGLPAGATLLITGVGGGVGIAAARLALRAGLTVVGTASAAKQSLVTSLGVVHVASGDDLVARVRAAAPNGVDAIFDLIGGDDLETVAELLPDRSKLISATDRERVARLGGSPVLRARNATVLDAVARLAVDGTLRPIITETFPLAQASKALRVVEGGHATGKVVITVPA